MSSFSAFLAFFSSVLDFHSEADPVFYGADISAVVSSFRFWAIYISSLQFDLIITGWKETLRALLCGVNWITHPKGWGKIGRNWESGGQLLSFYFLAMTYHGRVSQTLISKEQLKKSLKYLLKNQGGKTASCQGERKKEWEENKKGNAETCLRRGKRFNIVFPVISPFLNGVQSTWKNF